MAACTLSGCRVERLSGTAGTLAVRLAATLPGRSLTAASAAACFVCTGSRVVSANWHSNLMGDR